MTEISVTYHVPEEAGPAHASWVMEQIAKRFLEIGVDPNNLTWHDSDREDRLVREQATDDLDHGTATLFVKAVAHGLLSEAIDAPYASRELAFAYEPREDLLVIAARGPVARFLVGICEQIAEMLRRLPSTPMGEMVEKLREALKGRT